MISSWRPWAATRSKSQWTPPLADDLGADSLASVELVMALEEATGISIEDSALAEMKTVGDVMNYLNAHKQ